MRFIFFVIRIILAAKNQFSKKQLHADRIHNVILMYCITPEIVIHDYSFYVGMLLKKSLHNVSKKCIVCYECNTFNFLGYLLPLIRIGLQIEHTLVKPGGRGSQSAPTGTLKITNSNEYYLVRIVKFETLNNLDLIIDYSRINLHNIHASRQFKGYLSKAFCISPTLYAPYTSVQARKGIVTLFGNPEEPRRRKFLDALKYKGIDCQNVSGVYFNIDAVYRKVKIVINIRQTDSHDTLEELRILPALRCGAIVVCETAPYIEKTWYSQFIIWGALTELPEIIADVEKNYNEIHARIFGNAQLNSPFLTRMRRIECCNERTVMKLVEKIN